MLSDNPLTEWVELPAQYAELRYCNLLCGVIRGALDMVNLGVSVAWARDMLRGDDAYELRLKLVESRDEKYPYKEED